MLIHLCAKEIQILQRNSLHFFQQSRLILPLCLHSLSLSKLETTKIAFSQRSRCRSAIFGRRILIRSLLLLATSASTARASAVLLQLVLRHDGASPGFARFHTTKQNSCVLDQSAYVNAGTPQKPLEKSKTNKSIEWLGSPPIQKKEQIFNLGRTLIVIASSTCGASDPCTTSALGAQPSRRALGNSGRHSPKRERERERRKA